MFRYLKENNYKFNGIYVKFFLAMAVLMFVAILIVGFISYRISSSALTGQISEEKVNTLTQTRNTADVTLKEIEKSIIAESISSELLRFTNEPFGSGYENLKQTVKNLVKIKDSNKFIYSIYVYLPGHNTIVTSEDGFWKLNDFYDLSWRSAVRRDTGGSWQATRNIKTFWGESLDVVTYVTSIPFNEFIDVKQNLVVVNVYEKELQKLIQGQDITTSGISCITDSEGKVIAHPRKNLLGQGLNFDAEAMQKVTREKDGTFTYEGNDGSYLVSHVRSEYNRWNYISVIPEKQVLNPIWKLRVLNVIVAGICCILGLIAAYFISSRIYRPISDTLLSAKQYVNEVGALPEGREAKDEMGFINATLEQMVKKNKDMKRALQKNESALKESFVLDLLLGSSMDEIQLDNKISQLGIPFSHPGYYVLVLLIDRYSTFARDYSERDRSLYCFGIKNIAEELLNSSAFGIMAQLDKDRFAAVVNCSGDFAFVAETAEEIRRNIKNIFKFTVTVGVSNSCSNPGEVGFAYNEALEAAKARMVLGGDRVIGKRDMAVRENAALLVSSSREEQILNNIKQGKVEEAIKNIERIVNLIRKEPGYPPEEIHQFFYSILCISIKAVNENGWSVADIFGEDCNLYSELVENDTIMDIYNWMNVVLMRISHFILEKKESKNNTLIESIMKYLHANYHKDISLNSMAEYVSLSTPYLSKLFKSETGENFLEYLTRIRVEKSKELLLDPSCKITAIAEKVNLGNAQNYIRIFKKYEGLTPGQYRETQIRESLENEAGSGPMGGE